MTTEEVKAMKVDQVKEIVSRWASREEEWCCSESELEGLKEETKAVLEWIDIYTAPAIAFNAWAKAVHDAEKENES